MRAERPCSNAIIGFLLLLLGAKHRRCRGTYCSC